MLLPAFVTTCYFIFSSFCFMIIMVMIFPDSLFLERSERGVYNGKFKKFCRFGNSRRTRTAGQTGRRHDAGAAQPGAGYFDQLSSLHRTWLPICFALFRRQILLLFPTVIRLSLYRLPSAAAGTFISWCSAAGNLQTSFYPDQYLYPGRSVSHLSDVFPLSYRPPGQITISPRRTELTNG